VRVDVRLPPGTRIQARCEIFSLLNRTIRHPRSRPGRNIYRLLQHAKAACALRESPALAELLRLKSPEMATQFLPGLRDGRNIRRARGHLASERAVAMRSRTPSARTRLWSLEAGGQREHGFCSSVSPTVDRPGWSQAIERWIGEYFKRKTQIFNGYGEQVASLYAGMDLRRDF
jgi:hypothetical protein